MVAFYGIFLFGTVYLFGLAKLFYQYVSNKLVSTVHIVTDSSNELVESTEPTEIIEVDDVEIIQPIEFSEHIESSEPIESTEPISLSEREKIAEIRMKKFSQRSKISNIINKKRVQTQFSNTDYSDRHRDQVLRDWMN
ncbi:hypothetical protein [Acanthamoeba castellanii mimivirus]|jgi:hypothetical protein|uniref:Uncharacterized protein R564 n=5 Tax=Mimivirus TaxID=315393 RepID=YR564_MIMIV|nr:hypothetical protein MIMI_gp0607 [Acanthamoeba polyphaga mimivirus]Q5UR42.1 RecName: Full=Uncharacterized protein R564; Flags: Precursor [Acanthamoeba polyphaga mimivirus]AHJ40218.1 hypothetical protein [Samba virus]ALR84153.1 hypothetical protein [Niemeyer virus]AMZ03008.1 hypothetical protein [Mimivirus Bombay]BAV61678.1 hypothetical protein [Acanthamoeba castellanii mimivirus]AAV50827.1 unknown [Acanthamoeba polyphaga mimivirus]